MWRALRAAGDAARLRVDPRCVRRARAQRPAASAAAIAASFADLLHERGAGAAEGAAPAHAVLEAGLCAGGGADGEAERELGWRLARELEARGDMDGAERALRGALGVAPAHLPSLLCTPPPPPPPPPTPY